jgi:hypothetical protein
LAEYITSSRLYPPINSTFVEETCEKGQPGCPFESKNYALSNPDDRFDLALMAQIALLAGGD